MARRAVVVLVLCASSTLWAAPSIPVQIRAQFCLRESGALSDDVQLDLTPIGFVGAAPLKRRVSVRSGAASFRLSPAVWRASLDASGLWAPAQDIVVQEGSEIVAVTVCARRLGRLAGSLSLGRHEAPSEIRAVLTSAPDEAASSPNARVREEPFACASTAKEWTCDVPSGQFDIEVRATGFVPTYYWGIAIAPADTLRLPAIPLRRAASVSGEIHERSGSPARHAAVALTPPDSSQPFNAGDGAQSTVSAVTNARGFFQLVGIPPGRYQILARGRDGIEGLAEVSVRENTESRLKAPLVLATPAALTIRVSPPTPPTGGPWGFTLKRSEFPTARIVTDARPDSRGEWRRSNVLPGPYRLELSTASGRWLVRTIDVEEGDQLVEIEAPSRRIGGNVRLGETPVEGRIVWGGQYGPVRIPLSLDENGHFEGLIPERSVDDPPWIAFVEGAQPAVSRNVENVVLPSDPAQDVEIVLPATSLRGTLVDDQGKPVPLAVVYVSSEKNAPLEQKKNRDDKGEFHFDGLAPGRYQVSAAAPPNLACDEVPVTLEENGDEARVRLVLRRTARVIVRVRSPETTPVPGARVYALPAQAPHAGAPVEVTDLKGEVTVQMPSGTVEILVGVVAAGYASRMSRVGVSQEGLALVDLARQGGTVRLRLASPPGDSALPVLYHGGTALALPVLAGLTQTAGFVPSSDSRSWTLPMMEPGHYTACVTSPGKDAWMADRSLRIGRIEGVPCATGPLGAGGELVLDLED